MAITHLAIEVHLNDLLKVATIAITHLAMDLGLKNTKQAIFRLYKSATTHLWQPSKSMKKKPMTEHLKKKNPWQPSC